MTDTKKKYWQFTKKFILKPLKWVVLGIVISVLSILIMLRIPLVQTKIAQYASEEISQILQHKVTIGHVDLNWIDNLVLKDVIIYDVENLPMISIQEVEADFDLQTIYTPYKVLIENVTLNKAKVTVKNIGNTSQINIAHFSDIILELTKSPNPKAKKKYTSFNIAKVTLNDSDFSFDDNTEPLREKGFDNYHFGFKHINGDVSGFRLIADTLDILVHDLSGTEEKTLIDICKISTFLRITDNSINMQKLDAHIGNSILRDSLVMKFDSYRNFNDFNHKINIEGNLKNCSFYTKDLAIFDEYLLNFNDYWKINGYIKGTVDRFSLKHSKLSFGNNSYFDGDLSFDGLPQFWQTYFSLKLKDSYLSQYDIRQYSNSDFDAVFEKFRYLKAKGSIIGFATDFVTSAKYQSSIGNWDTDLNIKIDSKKGVKLFKGDIATHDLDLGILTDNQKRVQHINLKGYVEGNGFDPEHSQVKLKAYISDVSIENKVIKNIDTDAIWAKRKFSGFIDVKDSNVVLTANGHFDLSKNVNEFVIDGVVKKIDLKALGITKTQTVLSTTANLNFKGLKLDDLVGSINVSDLSIAHEGKSLNLKNINVNALKNNTERQFALSSDVFFFEAKGHFLFSRITDELYQLYQEYHDFYVNKKSHSEQLYTQKRKTYLKKDQDVKFFAHLIDFDKITDLLVPELKINKNIKIEGGISITDKFKLDMKSDITSLKYLHHEFDNISFMMKSSKPLFDDLIDNESSLTFRNYKYKGASVLDSFGLSTDWLKDSLKFNVGAHQALNKIDITSKGLLVFDKNLSASHISVYDEKIGILSQQWSLNDQNTIIYKDDDFELQHVDFTSDSQKISLAGMLSRHKDKPLLVDIHNFRLHVLNPFLKFSIGGVLDTKFNVSSIYQSPIVDGNLDVKELTLDKAKYGELVGKVSWVDESQYLDLNLDLIKNQYKMLNVFGRIYPEAAEQLQMKGVFNKADISMVEPILAGVLTELSGKASGEVAITGSFAKPLVLGRVKVTKGQFKVDYLNTTYKFEDYIEFTKDMIGVVAVNVFDDQHNKALVRGGLFHNYFSDYRLDVSVTSKALKVMSTTYKDNDTYYGDAFVDGHMDITGPLDDITIEGDLTSLAGTKLHIPIGGISKVARENYISFVNRKSASYDKEESYKKKLLGTSGIKMKLNLFLTPVAYSEIIFDQKSGDIIRGTGHGKIKMEIDTKGDFNMYGDYVFQEGHYNFTMLNVINKDFDIKPGSRIVWVGDPYGGRLDVKAIYEQQAALLPIVGQTGVTSKDSVLLKRRYPSIVKLDLTGDLLSPDVSLGIDIKQTPPDLNIFVQDFKNRINTNEQELNRQVFSLVMLGRFSEETSINGSSLISSSLGEFFSNELTRWMSQIDEDLQIDIDLNTVGADGLNVIKLRLSRVFLDNRLRISVEDGFANTGKSNPNASAAGLAGNWTVEYMILKNGVIRTKIYNRTTQASQINNTITNTSVGVSILHTKDFDRFIELLNLKTGEENKNRKPKNPKETSAIRRDEENNE